MNDIKSKGAFVREVAKRAGFTIGDVEIILNTIVEVFSEAIREKKTIHVRGFGVLYYQILPARLGTLAHNKGKMVSESIRVIFRLADSLRNPLKKKRDA